jgi:hypothetical protein
MRMSDNKEHTMQGGVDWELRTAEEAMVAAPGGSKELALAMRRHADGVRNMMQSELVPSFQNAIDNISEKHTVRILGEVAMRLDQITGYVQTGITLAREGIEIGKQALAIGQEAQATGLAALSVGQEALAIARASADQVIEVKKDVGVLKQSQSTLNAQLSEIKQQLVQGEHERAALSEKLDVYIAGSKRGEVEALQIEIRELRGEYSPEQRALYINILPKMIAEWIRTHPDDLA